MKSLFFIWLLFGFYGMAVSRVKEYLYSPNKVRLSTAEAYCGERYGKVGSITSEDERNEAVNVMGGNSNLVWIGLNRTTPHVNLWYWADGEDPKFTKWSSGEPNDQGPGENCVVMRDGNWFDTSCDKKYYTLCSRRFLLVKEKKTWEEALKLCRKNYSDLVFVDSQTQLDLLKIESVQSETASVWTGLYYRDARWFWVNRMQLGNLVSLPQCPVWPYRCGAYNFNTNVWQNRDCSEELNFLCYY